jgi:methyltransferase (TIGR00027 family)
MRGEAPSQTAFATAYMRAVHVNLDGPPPVLNDRVAFRLLPTYMQRVIRHQKVVASGWSRRLRIRDPAATAMRSQIVVRARYAEDCLKEVGERGGGRYVILGAGLDTFALRQQGTFALRQQGTFALRQQGGGIEVLEIDHPATQRWKRHLLARRGLEEPDGLTYLSVDFERESLSDVWIEGDQPDFVSWLGTTYYLSRNSIRATLEAVAGRTRKGSQLVLDYWDARPRTIDPLLWGTRIAVALQGEPMRSLFEPDEIESLAGTAGWRIVDNLTAADQNKRYLSHRKDGLSVPAFAHLLRLER